MQRFAKAVFRFVFVAILEATSLLVMDWLVPAISLRPPESVHVLTVAMTVALVLALMNSLVRPLFVLLTLPLNVRTLGLPILFINAATLLLTAYILPYLRIPNFGTAIVGTLVLAAVNTFLMSLTTIDDDYSFFEGVVQWLSKRQQIDSATETDRGLVMLEIDGLSYLRILRAVEQGRMPTVAKMLEDGTHVVSPYDCGLPSQTLASQAAIMYRDNYDIPAFRWYDKDRGKMMVSSNFDDAAELNDRYANGNGLLRGGSSICNCRAGDAEKSIFTMSVLKEGNQDIKRRRQEDLYLFWLNPYIFTRSIILTLWDILVEIGQALRQRIHNVQPRMNRFHKACPILRAITNVLLRDMSTYMVVMDVIRGVPAIYTTYIGYDEIAHHAGPDSPDAMNSLRALDTQLRRILDVIRRKAPRPYDIFLLSDHGQSVGATFEQRYGQTLAEFIEAMVEKKAIVAEASVTQSSQSYTAAVLAELKSMEQTVGIGGIRGAALGGARRALLGRLEEEEPQAEMDAQVIICPSGNLANVYFDLHAGKIGVHELNEVYAGLVDALVAHLGVGLVVAYDGDDQPWVLGKCGARNLKTGAVTESDPLVPFGSPDHRAAQFLRLAKYPHAGDLIVNSTLYPDGQVAAFEGLIGSHGGLGGQQTEAFLFHPSDMVVPPTSSAADVFALLDARRGIPGEPLQPHTEEPEAKAWALETLRAGIADVRTWVPRAMGALTLDRDVFGDVADDRFATGPALLILFILVTISSLITALDPGTPGTLLGSFAGGLLGNSIGRVLMVLLVHVAGRTLRGKGEFTRTMRAIAFALVPQAIGFLGPLPTLGPLFSLVATVLTILAVWIAVQEALGLRSLAAGLIPIAGLLLFAFASIALAVLIGGTALTLETMLGQLGLGEEWYLIPRFRGEN
jgi:uncharacterized membrane protein YvlD (DUF360 family)